MGSMGERTIGIMGGLGPEATVDLYAKILARTGATRDQEHLHVIIDSNPKVPDRNAAIAGTGESAGPALVAMARRLEQAGADIVAMACNTAHHYEADIRRAIRVPFISMVEETCDAVARQHPRARRIGLLAVRGCLDAKVYDRAILRRGWTPVTPDTAARDRFVDLVYRIKAGDTGPAMRNGMAALGNALIDQGAEVVLAACTEVPLVLKAGELRGPLIESTEVLADRLVQYARGEVSLPAEPVAAV